MEDQLGFPPLLHQVTVSMTLTLTPNELASLFPLL
jgi:hypothetical protein